MDVVSPMILLGFVCLVLVSSGSLLTFNRAIFNHGFVHKEREVKNQNNFF
jgi:hypothetical protein